ncbi:hypothetical protein KP509_05G098300 [Ceratopteris richardii]|uniref:Uncharacterized protein n=1 Tax=Ceratopteris richardii TaxID=49495 RepID=A0A8T2UWM2_CERRI|nr:hypothetical protein KP509_05G098300 [Ceratopteris richardii]
MPSSSIVVASSRTSHRPSLANPAPLGLFGFTLTTFVISSYNAGIFGVSASDPINVVVVLGVFYGGLAQAVAGLLEFFYGDAFAATAFRRLLALLRRYLHPLVRRRRWIFIRLHRLRSRLHRLRLHPTVQAW